MFCDHCGTRLREYAEFYHVCGARQLVSAADEAPAALTVPQPEKVQETAPKKEPETAAETSPEKATETAEAPTAEKKTKTPGYAKKLLYRPHSRFAAPSRGKMSKSAASSKTVPAH